MLVKGFTYPFIPAASSAPGVFTYGAHPRFVFSSLKGLRRRLSSMFATIQLNRSGSSYWTHAVASSMHSTRDDSQVTKFDLTAPDRRDSGFQSGHWGQSRVQEQSVSARVIHSVSLWLRSAGFRVSIASPRDPYRYPLGSLGRFRDSTSSHSDDPKGTVNGPTLGTIPEKSAHKGVGGQKRCHGVTALQPLDLRVTPE